MEFLTQRLKLRRLVEADVTDGYVRWLNDPGVTRFLETRHEKQDERAVRAFVESKAASQNEYLFGMFRIEDGRHIGNIKVGPVRPYHNVADVSLLIGERDCWGSGYATEAIAGLSRYAFDVLRIEKLSASMYAENEASRRAFLACGYLEEGRRRGHCALEGRRSDLVELGALPGDIK